LLVAGPAIIVAANQPPAAAIASDEMKSDVDCIFPPDDFVYGDKLSPARQGDPGLWRQRPMDRATQPICRCRHMATGKPSRIRPEGGSDMRTVLLALQRR
jgi:hypothetical protein